jgi:hypothetical protein
MYIKAHATVVIFVSPGRTVYTYAREALGIWRPRSQPKGPNRAADEGGRQRNGLHMRPNLN